MSGFVTTGPLREQQFLELVLPQLRAVFASLNPFDDDPFLPGVESWVLLPVPLDYALSEAEISAVASAADGLGDDGFFEVEVEGWFVSARFKGSATDVPYDDPYIPARYFAWKELDAYLTRPVDDPEFIFPSLETAIIGAARAWGILISHESHALAGGPSAFVSRLLDALPPYDQTEWFMPPPVFGRQRPPATT